MTATYAARLGSVLLTLLLASPAFAESGALVTGWAHACRITPDERVECWGNNSGGTLPSAEGQLGDGTNVDRPIPGPVVGLPEAVRALAAGEEHTCAITVSGALYCWGHNEFGQLGDGSGTNRLVATRVTAFTEPVSMVTGGGYHSCAIVGASRTVWCWGRNDSGQIGEAGVMGTDSLVPVAVASLGTNVTKVEAGGYHTCALLPTGEVRCFGRNDRGQLGRGGGDDENPAPVAGLPATIESIAFGDAHGCALDAVGGVRCWGRGGSGELGNGGQAQSTTPVQVIGLASGVRAIALGGGFSCAITFDGAGLCWGYNVRGALGLGDQANRSSPTPVFGLGAGVQELAGGSEFACALNTAGAATCTGNNTHGQLGDGTMNDRLVHALVANATRGTVTVGVTLRGAADDADDQVGASVAIGEDAGDETIAIGAPGTASGGNVYVFVRAPGSTSRAPLDAKAARGSANGPAVTLAPPAGGGIGDKFGRAVATSPDGATIAVGAPQRNGNGSVFVFRRPAGGWGGPAPSPIEIAAPPTIGGVTAGAFGESLAYTSDGMLVVGAPASDVSASVDAGAAYAYVDDGTQVSLQAGGVLTATVPDAAARFGDSVAAENGMVVVGAPDEDTAAGAAHGAVYTMPANAGSVGAATRITAAGGAIGDKFGASVGIDRGTLVVGAPGDDTASGTNSGSARVFRREGGSAWQETNVLVPNVGDEQGAGEAIAVRAGNIVVGAPLAAAFDKPGAGRGYLYRFDQDALAPEASAEAVLAGGASDQFGRAIALTRRRIGVGVPNARAVDGNGDVQPDAGRTDTFIFDGIFRAQFE